MHRKEESNRIKVKRRISGIMVAVLLITGIGATTYFNTREVQAKDTLESIRQVVGEINTQNPFRILEIVPDTVSFNVSINNCYDEPVTVSGDQIMGFMGYYVKEYEPIRQDMRSMLNDTEVDGEYVYSSLSDSNLRYNMFSALATPLVSADTAIAYDNGGGIDAKPLYIGTDDGYDEIRQGESISANGTALSEAEFQEYVYNNGYERIERDYRGYRGDRVEYVDTAMGVMSREYEINGNYLRKLVVSDNNAATSFLNKYIDGITEDEEGFSLIRKGDDETIIVGAIDNNFCYLSFDEALENTSSELIISASENRTNGIFDPNLKYVVGSDTAPNVYATFRYDKDLTSGYYATVIEEITEAPSADRIATDYYVPLYTLNDEGIYVYAGDFGDVFSATSVTTEEHENEDTFSSASPTVTLSALDDGKGVISPKDAGPGDAEILKEDAKAVNAGEDNGIVIEDGTGAFDEREDEVVFDGDQTVLQDSEDNEAQDLAEGDNTGENEEEASINEQRGAASYYILGFEYTDTLQNQDFYSVNNFRPCEQDTGAQYIIDISSEKGALVPNITGRGVIVVRDECPEDLFIYDYDFGNGNYSFMSEKTALRFWQNNADIKPYHIRGAEIYYKINITNNEWFKRNILDRDAGEQCDKLPVEVYTRPASKVTAEDITSARFIAVMSGDAQYCIGDSFDNYSYGDNDLSVRSFRNILGLIVESRIPIIGDYRIVTDYETLSENSTTYVREPVASDLIKKLRLSHDDMYKCFNTLYSISDEFYDVNGLSVSSDAITLSGNDNHFVNENVYIYNRKLDNQSTGIYTCLLNDKLMRAFNSEEIKAGFADVLTDVETENLYRKAEKLKELDKTISEATAIRYIIGFRKKRAAGEHKGEMRILEIEPCASYDLSTESEEVDDNGNIVGSKLFVHGDRDNPLIDQDGAKIIVTQMTTAQFIGRIEDINVDYDMIYFGMNTDKMNTRSIETEDVTAGRATQEDYNAQVKMTDYNDLNMDGLVYSNVGDYAYMQIHLAGMLDNEYVSGTKGNGGVKSAMVIKTGNDRDVYKTRYGGNDITQEKVNALKDFVNAGFPIVMDDSFFIRNTDQTYSINKCKVDTASYMYSFIESVMNEDNVFKLSNLSPGLFDFYLNLSKPKLTMYGNAAASMTTTQNVYKDTEDGYFYVPFNFSIDNKGAVSATDDYYVNLYIDVNADGKYSATQESVDFTRLVNSDSGEVISKTGGTYAVRPGVTYYGTYRLSGSQAGVIPWRIVVKQSGNTLRRANATGYYQMSNTKPEIKVLQINSVDVESVDNGRGSNEGNASYLERSNLKHGDNYEVSLRRDGWIQKIEGVYHSTWNMQQEYEAGSGNKFYDLLTDNCVPYDIKITTVTSTEFSAMSPTYSARVRARYRINDAQVRTLNTTRRNQMSVEINGYDEELRNSIKQEYSDAIAAYDMVIMGFGDCYVAPNMIAVEAIKDFVNSGHSILFTHDCTSMMSTLVDENGYSSGTVYNGIRLLDTYSANTGYECNEKLRNLVGMDRYNVLNEAKDGTYVHDSIYKPRTSRTDSNKITSSQIHGFTYGNINTSGYFGTQYKDVYEKASPNKNVTEPLANLKDIDHTHDDYGWIDNYRNPENGSDVDPNCDSYDKRHHIHTVGQYYDMSVKKVNGGQITEYPYKLPDKFPVANTHEQWFQLDVTADDDFDGESDIVVWYCLDDSGLVDDEAKNGKPADMYAMSPGDVRNNYYIYNKGNVTYSGVGHSDVMKGDSENEMKLFINTIVAAYRSGLHAPDITFKEGYAGKRNTDNIYITYDEQLDISQHADQGEIIGVTKDVYFMPEQVSLVQNAEFVSHTMSAKFYYEVPAGTTGATTIRYNTNEYTVKELPVDTTSVTYMDPETGAILEGDLNNLKNGAVHKVSFAMDAMGAFMGSGSNLKNTINLFVVATDSVTNSKTGVNSTMTSTAAANIVRTEVFDLD